MAEAQVVLAPVRNATSLVENEWRRRRDGASLRCANQIYVFLIALHLLSLVASKYGGAAVLIKRIDVVRFGSWPLHSG